MVNSVANRLMALQHFVAQLRDPETGDPWILKQDFKSLIDLTIEEAYELADSVEKNSASEICDELGDLLLHVFLYAKIAEENGKFNLDDIAKQSLEKQKRRKLYFENPEKISAEEAIAQWEENKRKEREQKSTDKNISALDGITRSIPNLNRALILQSQAARVGFDWPSVDPVLEKLNEEIAELKEVIELAPEAQEKDRLIDELGDVLFTCVNIARHLDIHPELALRHANNKFEKRFRCVENELLKRGKKPEQSSLDEMDAIWDEIKE